MEMTFFFSFIFFSFKFYFLLQINLFFQFRAFFPRFFSFVKLLTLILCCGHVSSGRGMGRAYTNDWQLLSHIVTS